MAKQTIPEAAYWMISHGQPVYAVAHARATVRGNSTVDADLARLEEKMDSSGSFTVTSAVVNPDAWQEADEGVLAVIPVTGITETTVPLVFVNPEQSSVALQCGLGMKCTSDYGTVKVYAKIAPVEAMELTILAMFSQSTEAEIEVNHPDTPVLAYYRLPAATKDTLGGVKIGSGIDIAEDGTISSSLKGCNHVLSGGIDDGSHRVHDEKLIHDLVATSDEVDDALNKALGIEADADPDDPLAETSDEVR